MNSGPLHVEEQRSSYSSIIDLVHAYVDPERARSTAIDLITCGPPLYGLSAAAAETGVGAALAAYAIAKCIPDLIGDLLFPVDAMKAEHSAMSMLTPWGMGAALTGGVMAGSEYVLLSAQVANSLHDIKDLTEAYPLGLGTVKAADWFATAVDELNELDSTLIANRAQGLSAIPSLQDDPFWGSGDSFLQGNPVDDRSRDDNPESDRSRPEPPGAPDRTPDSPPPDEMPPSSDDDPDDPDWFDPTEMFDA